MSADYILYVTDRAPISLTLIKKPIEIGYYNESKHILKVETDKGTVLVSASKFIALIPDE